MRVALIGVGQELNGDDAIGLLAVRALRRRLGPRDDLLAIEGGTAPENVTGALRRFGPDVVVLVDAAMLGARPGTIRWIDPADTDGISASSHTLPARLVATYLTGELECQVMVLGVQPATTEPFAPVSPAVRRALRRLVVGLTAGLSCSGPLGAGRAAPGMARHGEGPPAGRG